MEITNTHIAILDKMYHKHIIGGKHASVTDVLKNIKDPQARKVLNELIKENLIIHKTTGYGKHISLNHNRIDEIIKLIQP